MIIQRKLARPKISYRFAFSMMELAVSVTIIAVIAAVITQSGRTLLNARLANAQAITKSSPVPDIDGLVGWWETTMPQSFDSTAADDGDTISTWYDLSPEKNNATAGTAPTYTANVVNGLPVVRFNGSSTYLDINGTYLVQSNYTLFFVGARRSSSPSTNFAIAGTTGSSFQNLHMGWYSTTFRCAHYSDGTANVDYIDYNVGSYVSPIFQTHSVTFNSVVGRSYYQNGTLATSINSVNSKKPITSWGGSAIGRFNTSYFNGDVAEIIMFNRALTNKERKDVEQYLGKKWGISPIGTD